MEATVVALAVFKFGASCIKGKPWNVLEKLVQFAVFKFGIVCINKQFWNAELKLVTFGVCVIGIVSKLEQFKNVCDRDVTFAVLGKLNWLKLLQPLNVAAIVTAAAEKLPLILTVFNETAPENELVKLVQLLILEIDIETRPVADWKVEFKFTALGKFNGWIEVKDTQLLNVDPISLTLEVEVNPPRYFNLKQLKKVLFRLVFNGVLYAGTLIKL